MKVSTRSRGARLWKCQPQIAEGRSGLGSSRGPRYEGHNTLRAARLQNEITQKAFNSNAVTIICAPLQKGPAERCHVKK